MKDRIFVSWIGHQDLAEFKRERGVEAENSLKDLDLHSKIREALNYQEFEAIHLFSTFGEQINQDFEQWLGKPVVIHSVQSEKMDPFDGGQVYAATDKLLAKITKLHPPEKSDIHIHYDTGTDPMQAVIMLLALTKYRSKTCAVRDGKLSISDLAFMPCIKGNEKLEAMDALWATAAMRTLPNVTNFGAIIGNCAEIRKAVTLATRVAIRSVNVLLLGESGVGKELFAEAIHKASGRKGKFIPVNCAAIPSELFEAELFGTVKGSGTGIAARDGYFKEADGGTLFLDEVGELYPQHQSKLLRAIQSADTSQSPTRLKLQTVGSSGKQYDVDVRIVAATNRNLLKLTQSSFRNDLYYRLATFPILIPSLRERGSDVIELAKHLLTRINKQFTTADPTFTSKSLSHSATRRLKSYHWPGNVRELNAVLTRAVIMATGPTLDHVDIDQAIAEMEPENASTPFSRQREPGFELDARLDMIQTAFIEDALADAGGSQPKAAELLGIDYQRLNRYVRKLKVGTEKQTT